MIGNGLSMGIWPAIILPHSFWWTYMAAPGVDFISHVSPDSLAIFWEIDGQISTTGRRGAISMARGFAENFPCSLLKSSVYRTIVAVVIVVVVVVIIIIIIIICSRRMTRVVRSHALNILKSCSKGATYLWFQARDSSASHSHMARSSGSWQNPISYPHCMAPKKWTSPDHSFSGGLM